MQWAGGNKLKKFYLAGTFGQGGSTANIFSKHTLFISKPIPEKNNSNKIYDLSFLDKL